MCINFETAWKELEEWAEKHKGYCLGGRALAWKMKKMRESACSKAGQCPVGRECKTAVIELEARAFS